MKWLRLIAALLAFTIAPVATFAQVTPASGTPVLSASSPGGAFNVYPFLSGASFNGGVKFAFFAASCTPAASTSCTTSAVNVFGATPTTQFAAAPMCFDGAASNTVAVFTTATHSWNGAFTADTITLVATASTSSLLAGVFLCVGP